MKEKKKISNI